MMTEVKASLIDPEVESCPIWIVWSLMVDATWLLRAVCLTSARAERFREHLESRPSARVRSYYVEASFANHLYAGRFVL